MLKPCARPACDKSVNRSNRRYCSPACALIDAYDTGRRLRLPCGSWARYKGGCRCEPCCAANTAHARDYRNSNAKSTVDQTEIDPTDELPESKWIADYYDLRNRKTIVLAVVFPQGLGCEC